MTMRRDSYLATPQTVPTKTWRLVDADNVPLGRLAVDVANVLMGKHRPEYTPHVDCGDFVIIVNAHKIAMTGNKAVQQTKLRYTRHTGGLHSETYESLRKRRPEQIIEDAVRRMMPKNRLSRHMLKKLKIYRDGNHPHASQQPVKMEV